MDKYAIVTGASTGIGQAISVALANSGYYVYLLGRNDIGLSETKNLISDSIGKSEVVKINLANKNDVDKFIEGLRISSLNVDVLVNAAAIWHGDNEVYADKRFETFTQQVVLDTLTVGVIAPMLLVHGLLPLMKNEASIVNISGTFENGGAGWLPYYVSKRALEDFTIGLAAELEEKGVRVNCISPSDTATEAYSKYFPQYMEIAVDPKEIANEVIRLCTEDFQTTGEVIVIKEDKAPFSGFHS